MLFSIIVACYLLIFLCLPNVNDRNQIFSMSSKCYNCESSKVTSCFHGCIDKIELYQYLLSSLMIYIVEYFVIALGKLVIHLTLY